MIRFDDWEPVPFAVATLITKSFAILSIALFVPSLSLRMLFAELGQTLGVLGVTIQKSVILNSGLSVGVFNDWLFGSLCRFRKICRKHGMMLNH